MGVREIKFEWDEKYSIFLSERYLKTFSDKYGWLGGFQDNKLICVLPYLVFKRVIFKFIRLPEGLTFINEVEDEEGIRKMFLNEIIRIFKNQKYDFIFQPPPQTIFADYPDDAVYAPYGTYRIDLTKSEEELWKNVQSRQRSYILKGERNNVEVKTGLALKDIAFNMIRLTMKRSDIEFMSKKKYERYINGLKGNIEIFIAFCDGKPQNCAVVFYSANTAFYVYGGSIDKPIDFAGKYMHWYIIKHFKKLSVHYYDFVGTRINPEKGSKQEGIKRFKERFGGELIQGYLWKYPINKLKYKLFNEIFKILKRKEGDIIDEELKQNESHTNL